MEKHNSFFFAYEFLLSVCDIHPVCGMDKNVILLYWYVVFYNVNTSQCVYYC